MKLKAKERFNAVLLVLIADRQVALMGYPEDGAPEQFQQYEWDETTKQPTTFAIASAAAVVDKIAGEL